MPIPTLNFSDYLLIPHQTLIINELAQNIPHLIPHQIPHLTHTFSHISANHAHFEGALFSGGVGQGVGFGAG